MTHPLYPTAEYSGPELQEFVHTQLALPERLQELNLDATLPQELGEFLIDKGLIKDIGVGKHTWGYMYGDNRNIYLSGQEMPEQAYDRYIFRLGRSNTNGESYWPQEGDEVGSYRFLHETGHAYQEYQYEKDNCEGLEDWSQKVLNEEIDTNYSLLWKFCRENREIHGIQKGLSTWGNVADYSRNSSRTEELNLRAVEDANELVVMYLWNPNYLRTFLKYCSGNMEGYDERDLQKDGLTKISDEQADGLLQLIEMYVKEMKDTLSVHRGDGVHNTLGNTQSRTENIMSNVNHQNDVDYFIDTNARIKKKDAWRTAIDKHGRLIYRYTIDKNARIQFHNHNPEDISHYID